MRSKRLLAMLLALCLMVSCVAPTAFAVEGPADSIINAEKPEADANATEETTNSPISNDLLVSGSTAEADGIKTMRDSLINKMEEPEIVESAEGDWVIAPAENPGLGLMVNETPDCLEELKEAAALYNVDDVVAAFVVMEDAPLAESHKSRSLVSASVEKAMIQKQNSVISAIEKSVLNGEKLTVRYQFTYLTNSFSIETTFENLEKIARINGVKSVFIMPVYNPTTADTNTVASGAMTGVHTVWEDLGYTGEGMKIAIIDTGLDLDHPSFGALSDELAANENYMTVEDVAAVLEDLNAYKYRSSITAENLYRTTKVPYAFNYVDANLTADHSADGQGDHGTHVAGIAAANDVEGSNVIGMAPNAQIIVMKVFGANGGAYTDDIVAALEDAMTLGCDVVNASLGSPAGFSSTNTEIDLIYERLAYQDIVATISAGNEGTSSYNNMWGTDMNRTQNPDNAAIGSPSLYANAFSIASAENSEVQSPYFALADGTKVFFSQTYEYYMGQAIGMESLIGQELEFVVIDGLGEYEDYYDADGNSLVEGKVAVVSRGTINFGLKIYNAELAGAVCCVVANNNNTDDIFNFYMNTSLEDADGNTFYPGIPACLITMEDGAAMAAIEAKTMTVSETTAARVVEGGQMSSFSSWGVSPDLRLVPDITGIGGNVYSCYDGGYYGVMSGTSMSAPQIAGVSALVMQYLYEKYPDETAANDGTISAMARAILMSTADPIISSESGLEASPRQQGAGLVNAADAVKTNAYLTVNGDRPKAELGDSKSGKFTFTFEINNMGDEDETYTLSSRLLTEDIIDYGIGEYFMAGYDVKLSGDVSFSEDTVTVPAGETVAVDVTITLSDADKVMFARYWENGGYVEGFIYLTNTAEDGIDLNLPFLGFYGDWTQAPAFDTAYWYDNSFWGVTPSDGLPEGDEYYHVLWTSLAGTDFVLGINPYSGAYTDRTGNVVYDPANNSVSPNGDGVVDGIDEIYLSLLRNAKALTFTYTVDGEEVHKETITNAAKTMYISNYGQVVPWLYSWYGNGIYDFSGLENNDQVLLTIEAKVDYGMGGDNVIQIPITVDTEAPQLLDAYQIQEADGSHSLVIITEDNVNVAAMFLMNRSGSRIYATEYAFEARADGTYMATFNVDELGTELMVALGDYAGNESYFDITFTEAGANVPDMTPYADELFAYRVFDNYIYSDHMYGWVSVNKPAEGENANLSVWTDDYLEFAAINAAEYVDGKIFAVDAFYNLVVMDPGLFDRKTVTNLGVNVLDMTFDDSTDTMYVLSKQDYYTYLYSMDLLTGELTRLKYYGYYEYGPWAIADDDNGTLYAIKYNSSSIYTLDAAGGTYAMTAVADENGDEIIFTDSNGNALAPSAYSQSITCLDGKLYWAYFKNTWMESAAELITIDTTDWTSYASPFAGQAYDADYNVVEYYPVTELVGLLSLNETDYQIPASDEATSVSLNAEQIILSVNGYQDLVASWLPWNYALDESQLVWSSDDESVATVDNGRVTGVSEGVTNVTVTYGDLSATCEVVVVVIEGNFEAYNYYSADGYYGHMIDVDMETMDYSLVSDLSPVDFLAGDYNGHDGYFYGYDMGGQLYRYDYATNEVTALGTALGTYPVDMAYDYSSGMMYALVLDYMTYENTLYAVNMTNGKTMEVATGAGLMTLACSTDGTMYAMDASGYVNQITIQDYSAYGMGYYMEPMPILEEPFGELQMLASMCWDHNNDVLLWNWCEAATVLWIDVENGYYVNLGDPTESGVLELVGMHVVPDEIPELADAPVESVTSEDMLILTGYEKVPAVTVAPFNATCQDLVMTIADPTVVEITAAGALKALKAGTTTVTASLEDKISGNTFETTFTVTVQDGADNVFAHLLTDVATMNAQAWIQLNPGNPGTYDVTGYFDYTIFTAEQVDGKIYTYGYDANDWEANQQFFILDADSKAIEYQVDMGEAFPFIYDMTYDYVTATMYVLAGAAEDNTELYVADMETGKITLLMETEPLFLALSAGPEGKLYAIENSTQTMDWETWETILTNANLWVIDPLEGTMEMVGDTGLKSNMISSLAYDYDTETLYWTPFAQESAYISYLAIVDTETAAATPLGTIGMAGAQVGGLYILCDAYPETDESNLHNLMMAESKKTIITGQTGELGVVVMPGSLDVELTWTSSDESVATVDENGVVTGVAQGSAVITATASYNGVTKSATCNVAILNPDAAFLAWNATDMGWSLINRHDYTVVENLTEGETTGVAAITNMGNDVYGYDENNQFFKLDTTTYERTLIGEPITAEEGWQFVVKDLAYDAANDRVLMLGDNLLWEEDWQAYSEVYNGCRLYSVDLTTGETEELYVFADYSYVYAMSVGTEGEVYFYNTFNDDVCVVDLTTETVTKIVSLQSQSIAGDGECEYALYYDEMTDTLYLLFTSNGRFYKMITVDALTGNLTDNGYVGEVVKDGWYYIGDGFSAMTFVNPYAHLWIETSVKEATCTEAGEAVYSCRYHEDCTKTVVLPATGHEYGKVQFSWNFVDYSSTAYQTCVHCDDQITHDTVVTSEIKEATCTESGETVYTATCEINGESFSTTLSVAGEAATGHNYEDGICTECGDSIRTELKIITQPENVTVAGGEKATVTVKAQGDGLTYKWYYKNAGASKFTYTSSFSGNKYYVTMTAVRAERQVYCVITDKYGNSVTSDTVTLSMDKEVLGIATQPTSQTVNKGVKGGTTVRATGEGLTYTWYVLDAGAEKWVKSSITSNTYAYKMTEAKSGRHVYCVITDANGDSVTTDIVTFNMACDTTITKQPADVTVAVGSNARTSVTASGDGLTYTWYVKGASAEKWTKSSVSGNAYSFKMTEAKSGRQVYCVITDANGNTIATDVVTLSMK